ncbi:hypothetical protein F4778DRAFT_776044 [Xylariomycetidae sp. FL2044]|nr:hypothetical protein F4778DRAFT_776044 [Xylariomycetidae sp. FL2044]
MSSHQSIGVGHTEAIKNGRAFHLSNMAFKATKDDILKLFHDKGFDNVKLYWLDLPANSQNQHKGWCHAELPNKTLADNAKKALDGLGYMGRSLRVGIINQRQGTTTSQASAQRQPSAARPSAAPAASSSTAAPAASSSSLENVSRLNQAIEELADKTFTAFPTRWAPQPREEPDLWLRNLIEHYQALRPFYERAQISASFVLGRVDKDHDEFLPRQYPSPAPYHQKLSGSVLVVYVKDKEHGFEKCITDLLSRRAEHESAGLRLWAPPQNPRDIFDKNKDLRRLEPVQDSIFPRTPFRDMSTFFQKALASMKLSGTQPGWEPGMKLGDDYNKPINQVVLYQKPGEMIDMRSVTSFSHAHKHRRPQQVGAGWGSWDDFLLWQSQGRFVELADVTKFEWELYGAHDTFRFDVEDDEGQLRPSDTVANVSRDWPNDTPETLEEKLNKRKDKNKTPTDTGRARGQRGRGRGGSSSFEYY